MFQWIRKDFDRNFTKYRRGIVWWHTKDFKIFYRRLFQRYGKILWYRFEVWASQIGYKGRNVGFCQEKGKNVCNGTYYSVKFGQVSKKAQFRYFSYVPSWNFYPFMTTRNHKKKKNEIRSIVLSANWYKKEHISSLCKFYLGHGGLSQWTVLVWLSHRPYENLKPIILNKNSNSLSWGLGYQDLSLQTYRLIL